MEPPPADSIQIPPSSCLQKTPDRPGVFLRWVWRSAGTTAWYFLAAGRYLGAVLSVKLTRNTDTPLPCKGKSKKAGLMIKLDSVRWLSCLLALSLLILLAPFHREDSFSGEGTESSMRCEKGMQLCCCRPHTTCGCSHDQTTAVSHHAESTDDLILQAVCGLDSAKGAPAVSFKAVPIPQPISWIIEVSAFWHRAEFADPYSVFLSPPTPPPRLPSLHQ